MPFILRKNLKNEKRKQVEIFRALLWRVFSYTVLFFHLFEENTSLLVVIPMGVSALIEYWKVIKAFKVRIFYFDFFLQNGYSSFVTLNIIVRK